MFKLTAALGSRSSSVAESFHLTKREDGVEGAAYE